MGTNPILELYEQGQSVWLDQISRALLESGDLARMVEGGEVAGVTSNPTIFDKAISGSSDYDEAIVAFLRDNPQAHAEDLYEELVVRDIRDATDVLRPVYDRTDGVDGYVSLEVSPRLAHDTEATVDEARRLFSLVGRPNLLIKVPATAEGLPAITTLIGEGVNVNVTLMFSQQDYLDVAEAYLAGLERLVESGGHPGKVASVASFFVSRIDTAVDALLPADSPLRGRIAVANTQVAYELFRRTFAADRFARLKEKGARVQRFLCASTSTKNPDYSDVLYVEELIGADTINTLPLDTMAAFRDHGRVRPSMTEGLEDAKAELVALAELGADLDEVCADLQTEGVQKFSNSFDSLLQTLAAKREAMAGS
jgi:transaldolase